MKLIFTVGHSNRNLDEFTALLKEHGVQCVIDVRRFPRSKFSHFNRENLELALREVGICYKYLGDLLGGFRKGGYEAYMKSSEFQKGLEVLSGMCENARCAIMCAERLYFKCHRRFIAKVLEEMGWKAIHL